MLAAPAAVPVSAVRPSAPAAGPRHGPRRERSPSRPPSLEAVDQGHDDDEVIGTESVARPAPAARGRTRTSSAVFEESAAQEYAYVAADVRRIAIVGGGLFAILIALFLLIEVFGVIHI